MRARNRNHSAAAGAACYWLRDLVFHGRSCAQPAPRTQPAVGIDLVLLMVTVIGGRIVPAFTRPRCAAGASAAVRVWPCPTVLARVRMVLVTRRHALAGRPRRRCGRGNRSMRRRCAWRNGGRGDARAAHRLGAASRLCVAARRACSEGRGLLGGSARAAFWLHALTIGALTTMIRWVMTRASLGHTGRALIVQPLTTVAYVLLTGAALIRVFGLARRPELLVVIVLARCSGRPHFPFSWASMHRFCGSTGGRKPR